MKYVTLFSTIALLSFTACSEKPAGGRLDVQAAVKLIGTEPTLQIVDVRTPGEVAQTGRIPNALLMNIQDEGFMIQVLRLDKTKPVLLYCATGIRSAQAAEIFKKAGFQRVYDLSTGLNGWLSAHQKTVPK